MVDVLPPAQMARWLRETATSTRAKGNSPWSDKELHVAYHVAFRLEQAADQLFHLRGNLTLAEEGLANYAQALADTKAHYAQATTDLINEREENERLRRLLNPRLWTREEDNAWCRTIPDLYKAFEVLRGDVPQPGEQT
jgi:hypothetical protein